MIGMDSAKNNCRASPLNVSTYPRIDETMSPTDPLYECATVASPRCKGARFRRDPSISYAFSSAPRSMRTSTLVRGVTRLVSTLSSQSASSR